MAHMLVYTSDYDLVDRLSPLLQNDLFTLLEVVIAWVSTVHGSAKNARKVSKMFLSAVCRSGITV